FRARSPPRHYSQGIGEGNVQGMNPISIKYVDSPSKRSRYRWDENRIPSVLEFLNDERRDERFFDLCQCRPPDLFAVISRHLLRQSRKGRIPRSSFKERFLNPSPRLLTRLSAHRDADDDENQKHQEKRQGLFGRKPIWHEQCDRLYQTRYRLHSLQQQQDGE